MAPTPLVADPDLAFLVKLIRQGTLMQMNSHHLGTVQSFDRGNRSAQVTLNYTQLVQGTATAYPVLVDCPVVILQGGGSQLTFPISKGDSCLVFFNDVNMDRWVSSGNLGALPIDTRLHAFQDALVLVGLDSLPGALAKSYFADGVELSFTDESGSSSIQLTDTIKLQNQITDLKTVLNGLIDAINTFVGTGVVSSGVGSGGTLSFAAGLAVFDAYKTTIGDLLT